MLALLLHTQLYLLRAPGLKLLHLLSNQRLMAQV
jgi:hypothetical protein